LEAEAITMTFTHPLTAPARQDQHGSRALRLVLVALLGFVGFGAVYGGIQMLVDPYEPMGMTRSLISRTPFETFTVPGVLLLVLVGMTPIVLAAAVLRRAAPHPLWAVAFGLGLVAWIVTQWVLVDAQLWLQPVIFAVGLAIASAAVELWRQEHRSQRR
jgi:hypothetical protein